MSEDENEAYIIFKYEGKQKEILFEEDDDDFNILTKKALKSFNIVVIDIMVTVMKMLIWMIYTKAKLSLNAKIKI